MYLAHRSATVKELAEVHISNQYLGQERVFSGDQAAISVGDGDAQKQQAGCGKVLAPPPWCLKPH